MKYNPALDGIRAIAVLMVVGFHAMVPVTGGGYLGVDIFFVLSGFLITSLLLSEIDDTGAICLRRFYARRLLRLTPALLLMLLIYLLVAPFAWPQVPLRTDLRDVLISLFYLSDYASAFWSIPVRLRHTWSLSIEEHFYLIWPLLVLALTRLMSRRRMAVLLAVLYLIFTGWRIFCDLNGAQGYDLTYYRFDTRLSGLTVGGLLAVLVTRERALRSVSADAMAFTALAAVALCACYFTVKSTSAVIIGIAMAELAALVFIYVAVNSPGSLFNAGLSHPVMSTIGRMSYGVYLWHYPIFRYLWGHWPWYWIVSVGGLASFLLAVASYYTVERAGRSYWRRAWSLPAVAP